MDELKDAENFDEFDDLDDSDFEDLELNDNGEIDGQPSKPIEENNTQSKIKTETGNNCTIPGVKTTENLEKPVAVKAKKKKKILKPKIKKEKLVEKKDQECNLDNSDNKFCVDAYNHIKEEAKKVIAQLEKDIKIMQKKRKKLLKIVKEK